MRWFMRLIRRDHLERELDAELKSHVGEETRRLEADGVPAEEARRRALAAFGGMEPMREQARDARGTRWIEDLARDVRYAGRMMRRSPLFTLTAVLSLAIGIGANAAMFSIADALLLRPLDVARPAELYFLNHAGYDQPNYRFSHPALERLRAAVPETRFAGMSSNARFQATRPEGAQIVIGQLVTGDWFDLLGVQASMGRVLGPDDTRALGGQPVVVLSHAFWLQEFGGSPQAIGSTLTLNGMPLTVVGVAAAGFSGVAVGERLDLWLPLTLQEPLRYFGNASIDDSNPRKPWIPQDGIAWLTVVARIPPTGGVAAAGARIASVVRAETERRAASAMNSDQRAFILRSHLELVPGLRGLSSTRDSFASPLAVLVATVAVVLLIACANLASLMLARSAARSREFALRLSLGARRGRLIRQLLTESVALACLGGLAGVAVARAGGVALLRLASSGPSPIPLALPMDWRLIAFTFVVSIGTGLLFGLGPALRLSRAALHDVIKSGGRVMGAAGRGRGLSFGKALVVAQVALSLALLAGAILFARTLNHLLASDTGFDRATVLSARFDPVLAGVTSGQLAGLHDRLLEAARAIPGVRSASLAFSGPVSGSASVSSIVIDGQPQRAGSDGDVREDFVGPDYLRTTGMTLLRGRDFAPTDGVNAPKVAVVNETMARHFFGEADPIGKRFGYDAPADVEIIGIVRDSKVDGVRKSAPAMVFRLLQQHPDQAARNLYIRVAGDAEAAGGPLRRAVATADPRLAVREIVSLQTLTERTVNSNRLVSQLTSLFGLLAVAVACLGLYGTVSYSVMRRTNEIGVRLALGATPRMVRWLVLRETLQLVVAGSVAGLLAALVLFRYLKTLLYDLSPHDPVTLASATVTLLAVGVLAGAIPAWRASRVDPLTAVRAE